MEQRASIEADDVVKPVTHKLTRIAPVRAHLLRRRGHHSVRQAQRVGRRGNHRETTAQYWT